MNRGFFLTKVVEDCRTQGVPLQEHLVEVLISPTEEAASIAKRRSIFIVAAPPEENGAILAAVNESLGNFPHYGAHLFQHGTVENPEFDRTIPLTDKSLENNWRCRLVRHGQINFGEANQFQKLVMQSTWRIIVNRRDGDFFARRDIYPFLWSPGSSVGGHQEYAEAVLSELRHLADPAVRFLDLDNDIVKAFANAGQSTYSDFQGDVPVTIRHLRANFDAVRDTIMAGFQNYFSNF